MPASRRALELAGVDGPHAFAQATAEVGCDADGRPTGLPRQDAACDLVERVAPQPTREEPRDRLAAALRAMAASGLTGGHVMVDRPRRRPDPSGGESVTRWVPCGPSLPGQRAPVPAR